MIGTVKEVRVEDLSCLFPRLAKRLTFAEQLGAPRGAITMSSRLPTVTQGRVALLGDASGTVDAVTGEGLHLAFRQANALADALAAWRPSPIRFGSPSDATNAAARGTSIAASGRQRPLAQGSVPDTGGIPLALQRSSGFSRRGSSAVRFISRHP